MIRIAHGDHTNSKAFSGVRVGHFHEVIAYLGSFSIERLGLIYSLHLVLWIIY